MSLGFANSREAVSVNPLSCIDSRLLVTGVVTTRSDERVFPRFLVPRLLPNFKIEVKLSSIGDALVATGTPSAKDAAQPCGRLSYPKVT